MKYVFIFFVLLCAPHHYVVAQSDSISKVAIVLVGSGLFSERQEIVDAEQIAKYLESKGYVVKRFYTPTTKWEEIKLASRDASVFIYRGHGTQMGIDGGFGGLVIGEFISAERIAKEMKFNQPAIVLFTSVCGGAGSSAEDESDIGVQEAYDRVKGSALPFLLAGAKGYYANNYTGGTLSCLKRMLSGESLGTAYLNSLHAYDRIERNEFLTDNRIQPSIKIALSSDPGGGVAVIETRVNGKSVKKEILAPKEYRIAYVGDPNFRLK